MAKEGKKLSTVKLDWKEVYYTNCPLGCAAKPGVLSSHRSAGGDEHGER